MLNIYLFQLIVFLKPDFNCWSNFSLSLVDKVTTGRYNFVSVIVIVELVITQSLDHVKIRLTSQLINDISSVSLQTLSNVAFTLKFGLPQIQSGILMFLTTPGNFAIFLELLFKYEHFFFFKNGNLIINGVPSLFYKSLGLQKSQILNSLVNWEKSGNAAWAYIQKT